MEMEVFGLEGWILWNEKSLAGYINDDDIYDCELVIIS